jgi:hypothetical protein
MAVLKINNKDFTYISANFNFKAEFNIDEQKNVINITKYFTRVENQDFAISKNGLQVDKNIYAMNTTLNIALGNEPFLIRGYVDTENVPESGVLQVKANASNLTLIKYVPNYDVLYYFGSDVAFRKVIHKKKGSQGKEVKIEFISNVLLPVEKKRYNSYTRTMETYTAEVPIQTSKYGNIFGMKVIYTVPIDEHNILLINYYINLTERTVSYEFILESIIANPDQNEAFDEFSKWHIGKDIMPSIVEDLRETTSGKIVRQLIPTLNEQLQALVIKSLGFLQLQIQFNY